MMNMLNLAIGIGVAGVLLWILYKVVRAFARRDFGEIKEQIPLLLIFVALALGWCLNLDGAILVIGALLWGLFDVVRALVRKDAGEAKGQLLLFLVCVVFALVWYHFGGYQAFDCLR